MRSARGLALSVVFSIVLGLAAWLQIPSASAQTLEKEAPRGHFEIGGRLAYAVPMGDLARNVPLRSSFSGQGPIWIDAGYRFARGFFLGAYFSYGILGVKDGSQACPVSWDGCGGQTVRLGVEVMQHLRSGKDIDPWFGVGIGYEWSSYHATLAQPAGDLTDDVTVRGFELLNLQLGVDFALGPDLGLGPFFAYTIAQFTDISADRTGIASTGSTGIASPSFHQWAIFGAHGTFGLL